MGYAIGYIFTVLVFPHMKEYASQTDCYNYGPVNGVLIIFMGSPLCFAIIMYLTERIKAN